MKRIYFLVALAALFIPSLCNAQFSLQSGDHTFEISGDILAGYNYRIYQPGETDFHKNNFLLDEARFRLLGRINNKLQYKLEMDMADLIDDIQAPTPALGFLKDAYITYKTPLFYIKAGYQKLPYSLNSLVDEIQDPFLSRPLEVTKIEARRDLGLTLYHLFPVLHLNVYGGLYSGMGEDVFSTNNTNGKPEYMGRIEYSFPAKYQDQILDMRESPVPIFQVGASARYMDNTVTSAGDGYELITLDGKETGYEMDATVFYRGFSAQFEPHYIKAVPVDSSRLFSEGKMYTYFRAGGFFTELNYYCKPLHSVLAVRYDDLNPTDLTYGIQQRTIAFAYNYFIRQNFLCVKLQYEHHLPTPYGDVIWKDDDLRAEFQVIFN
jgi:hypothetical protein